MRIRESNLVLIGIVIGIIIFILIDYNLTETSNKIALTGIFVNVIIGVYLINYIQNRATNSRASKDYFINQIEKIRDDYCNFLYDMRNDELTPKKIKKEFKFFSQKFISLEKFLKDYLKIKSLEVQKKNRDIHQYITESDNFNNANSEDNFMLDSDLNDFIIVSENKFNNHLTSLVIKINDK